ncbi:WD40 repeat domain-containing serine/threonine protein kinase, partial [Crocosphaera sp. XPORK-15E]|uniref:WD40 repeat domain-containing serine/threonine protein kinase n=1 Tax=Crocosphaera sp. XPORK-15E TaxID=3110247 RepID=UPI002B204661
MTIWQKGHQLDQGKYTIEKQLGEGGFGLTYLAKDKKGNFVVIKTINEQEIPNNFLDKIRRDFITEALNLAKCDIYPHVVKCIDLIPDNRFPAIVMEFIPGDNIEQLVNKRGILSETEALGYIKQVANGLKGVHERGILHRDIKPANIIIHQETQEAVLIDFGIAREYIPDQTAHHTQMYSPGYSPIEQIYPDDKDNKPGFYTDVYGLAATLYFMLTQMIPEDAGKRSFHTATYNVDPLKIPNNLNQNISLGMTQAIMRGLAISPKYRPQNVDLWLNLLPNFSSNISGNNVSVMPKSSPTVKQSPPSQNIPIKPTVISQPPPISNQSPPSQNIPIKPTVISQPPIKQKNSQPPVITVYNPNYINDGIIPGLSGTNVALTPDGKQLITYGSGGSIKVWNLTTGELFRTLEDHSDSVNSVAMSADGRTIVSGSWDKTIKVWNLATGELLRTLEGHSVGVSSVAISADGQTVVSGSDDNTINVWNLATGELLRTLEGHSDRVRTVAISPDGQTVLSGSWDNTIKVWNLATGELFRTLEGHSSLVRTVAISPDGQTVLSGSYDNTIKVWNLATGELLRTL